MWSMNALEILYTINISALGVWKLFVTNTRCIASLCQTVTYATETRIDLMDESYKYLQPTPFLQFFLVGITLQRLEFLCFMWALLLHALGMQHLSHQPLAHTPFTTLDPLLWNSKLLKLAFTSCMHGDSCNWKAFYSSLFDLCCPSMADWYVQYFLSFRWGAKAWMNDKNNYNNGNYNETLKNNRKA